MLFFNKKKESSTAESVEAKKNWYADRYQTVVVQRNFLGVVTIASLAGIIFSVLSVVQIVNSKTISPFVIGLEEKTGITNVIRPLQIEKYSYNDTLRRYFLTKYMNNRETYNPHSYKKNYYTIVHALSDNQVYRSFLAYLNAANPNNPIRLGNTQRRITIKSIVFLQRTKGQVDFPVQIRFRSEDGDGVVFGRNVQHKLATLSFIFKDLELTEKERSINPLGFQVTSYRVDDEIAQ